MMTVTDIGAMLELLEGNYGQRFYDGTDRKKVIKLWTVMFADDDPAEVAIAVKDCIATLQFPPRIADIKSRIAQSRMAGQPTEMEAWAKVYKAVIESTRIGKAQALFNELPPIAKELVALPEQLMDWHDVPGKELTTVVASNFMRSYRIKADREASYHALPADVQRREDWKLPKPIQEALPEPVHAKTVDEMLDDMDRAAAEYRKKYLLPEMRVHMPQHYEKLIEKGVEE